MTEAGIVCNNSLSPARSIVTDYFQLRPPREECPSPWRSISHHHIGVSSSIFKEIVVQRNFFKDNAWFEHLKSDW